MLDFGFEACRFPPSPKQHALRPWGEQMLHLCRTIVVDQHGMVGVCIRASSCLVVLVVSMVEILLRIILDLLHGKLGAAQDSFHGAVDLTSGARPFTALTSLLDVTEDCVQLAVCDL